MQKKSRLGQNFLVSTAVIEEIIDYINPQENEAIIEIGPGKGALTEKLLQAGVNLQAVEIDTKLISLLEDKFKAYQTNFNIIQADAAKNIYPPKNDSWRLVGNIPYQISSPLLMQLISMANPAKEIYLMLQQEFAQRLAAKVNTSEYGRLAIVTQVCFDVETLFTVAAKNFSPQPKVDSCFIRLTPNQIKNKIKDIDKFNNFLRQIFTHRRKKLKSNNDFPKAISEHLEKRPAELSIDDYINIYYQLQ